MGSSSSKTAAPAQVDGVSTQTNISEVSSGTHLLEIHMPSAGMGIGFIIGFVLISLALYTCHRQCRRCTRPKSRRRQTTDFAQVQAAPSAFPLSPFSPAPAPSDPMQVLILFAQLQQQQQREIAALTDELRLLSSRSRFSVVDEAASPSPVVPTPTTTTATVAPPATLSAALSAIASPSRLTSAPIV